MGWMDQIILAKGGSGGGGGAEPMIVTLTADADLNLQANKTFNEVTNALKAGKNVVFLKTIVTEDDPDFGTYTFDSVTTVASIVAYEYEDDPTSNEYSVILGDGTQLSPAGNDPDGLLYNGAEPH